MRKLTYKNATEKKKVRDFLFSFFIESELKKVVGLAGPDINDYLSYLESKGFNDFVVYENYVPTMIDQLKYIRTRNKVELKYGNVYDSKNDDNETFYDLDYCVTIRHMKEHIKKFRKNFIMTFSLRIGESETISQFFKYRRENIISVTKNYSPHHPVEHSVYKTTGGEYIYLKYFDTSTMCCFAKIN
jgi:hypothetical protein